MKKLLLAFLIIVAAGGFVSNLRSHAAETQAPQTYEYATIRWGGRDNTHVVRPSGNVEFVGNQLMKVKRPERVDDRSFYMNIVMNALAKEGYEFAGMTNDEIVMKRAVSK
jgi:hypothetical protein